MPPLPSDMKFIAEPLNNIRIGIIGSGIDPHSESLGAAKVTKIIDCTDAGRVDLEVVKPFSTSKSSIIITSPSGRLLSLPTHWKNPSSTWWAGQKRAWDFWPSEFIDKSRKERQKSFEDKVDIKIASELEDFNEHQRALEIDPSLKNTWNQTREEFDAKLTALRELASKRVDFGPLLDVIVWYDGNESRCVIGTIDIDNDLDFNDKPNNSEDLNTDSPDESDNESDEFSIISLPSDDDAIIIDLSHKVPITDYHVEQKLGVFKCHRPLYYSVNFYDDSNYIKLNAVGDERSTMIATMIASSINEYNSKQKETEFSYNVEIISIKVEENREREINTQAFLRACSASVDNICDIIYIDCDISILSSDSIRHYLRDEIIRKRNVICVAKSSNIDNPSFSADNIIMFDPLPKSHLKHDVHSISSPATSLLVNTNEATDAEGICIIAGTVSILKVRKYTYNAASIQNALQNALLHIKNADISASANVGIALPSTMTLFLFVMKSYHNDNKDALCHSDNLFYDISIVANGDSKCCMEYGRCLVDGSSARKVYTVSISSIPSPDGDDDSSLSSTTPMQLIASKDWLEVPKSVMWQYGAKFIFNISTLKLDPGYHDAEIILHDPRLPSEGMKILSVPVHIVKPIPFSEHLFSSVKSINFNHNKTKRYMFSVPSNSNIAHVNFVRRVEAESLTTIYVVHLRNMKGQRSQQECVDLAAYENHYIRYPVRGEEAFELVITQQTDFISTSNEVLVEVHFSGMHLISQNDTHTCNSAPVTLNSAIGFHMLSCYNSTITQQLAPRIELTHRRQFVYPSNKIANRLPGQCNLSQTFPFKLELSYNVQTKYSDMTVSWPFFEDNDALNVTFAAHIYDNDTLRRTTLNIRGKEIILSKGDYTIFITMLSTSTQAMDSLITLPIVLDTPLRCGNVKLDTYKHYNDFILKKRIVARNVRHGEEFSFLVSTDLHPKDHLLLSSDHMSGANNLLRGRIYLTRDDYGVPVEYMLSPGSQSTDEKRSLVDIKLGMLNQIININDRWKFLHSMRKEYPDHLPTIVAYLQLLTELREELKEFTESICDYNYGNIIFECEAIIGVLEKESQEEIVRFFSNVHEDRVNDMDKNERVLYENMKLKKDAFKMAYNVKLLTILEQLHVNGACFAWENVFACQLGTEAAQTFKCLERWLDQCTVNKDICSMLWDVRRELAAKRPTQALLKCNKILHHTGLMSHSNHDTTATRRLKSQAIKMLGWDDLLF